MFFFLNNLPTDCSSFVAGKNLSINLSTISAVLSKPLTAALPYCVSKI